MNKDVLKFVKKGSQGEYKLYKLCVNLYGYVRKYIIVNIPKVHADLRIHIMDECYNLIRNVLFASYNSGNIRRKYLKECKVNISLIDMLLEEIYSFNYIRSVKFTSSIRRLTDIKNYVYGWLINEEKSI